MKTSCFVLPLKKSMAAGDSVVIEDRVVVVVIVVWDRAHFAVKKAARKNFESMFVKCFAFRSNIKTSNSTNHCWLNSKRGMVYCEFAFLIILDAWPSERNSGVF